MMTSGIRVHVRHVRAACYCTRGLRTWLREHDIDITDFVKNGAPVEQIEAVGDPMALRVAQLAREEAANGR